MQFNWEAEHSQALREYFAKGLSFSEIAAAINARFNTSYSRNATLGRAKRLGLVSPDRSGENLRHFPKRPPKAKAARLEPPRERHVPEFMRPMPVLERSEMPQLRSVDIAPRHLALVDLEPGDCRYPYGGDGEGEAITFCGHPRREGSSYCTPHFQLTRNPDLPPERPAGTVLLRLVKRHEQAGCDHVDAIGERLERRLEIFQQGVVQYGTGQTQQAAEGAEGS